MLHAQGLGEEHLDLRKIEWVMQFRLGLQIDLQSPSQNQIYKLIMIKSTIAWRNQ